MSSDIKSIEEVKVLVFTQTETYPAAVKGQSVNDPLQHSQTHCCCLAEVKKRFRKKFFFLHLKTLDIAVNLKTKSLKTALFLYIMK